MDSYDWIIALRQQVENLARRNESASRCTFMHVKTKGMATKIVQLRELIVSNPAEAATFYIECSKEMDEIDKIVKRKTRKHKLSRNRVNDSSFDYTGESRSITPLPSESEEAHHVQINKSRTGFARLLCIPREDEYQQDDGVRNLWKTQTEFFLACLGFIVGVGNTLRFPSKVYLHGGGVFFIPYFACMILFGLPIVYLHLCIGQYSGLSPNGAFQRLMPIASGIGWALVLIAIPVCIYYNIIVAWTLYYFWFSFRGFLKGIGLPWDNCIDSWVSRYNCCDLNRLRQCFRDTNGTAITAPEAYFHFEVLKRSPAGVFTFGALEPHLVLALAVAWMLVFVGVFRGIGSIGSMGSITATVPYLMLTILMLRGISLPGADVGLSFLFTPKLEKLWSLPMWKSAAEQVFYELGIDAGPLIAMASFCRYRNNIYRDAVLLVFFDALTSVICGIVIFSFVGFLAHMSDSPVNTIMQHDPLYLAYTVYPGVTSYLSLGPMWGALFFVALVLSALDAEFAWMEMIATAIMYQMGWQNKRVENRVLATLCILFFICGLPLCANGGVYIFHAIENLNANWNSFSLGFLQITVICFVYGADKFIRDIADMQRIKIPTDLSFLTIKERLQFTFGPVGPYIKWAWTLFCPGILMALIITSIFSYERITFENYVIPWLYELIAWIVMISPLFVIPFAATHAIIDNRRRKKPWKDLISPINWRPIPSEQRVSSIPPPNYQPPKPGPTNGYTYIDPMSRGQSTKSRLVVEEDYTRRTGRIADFFKQAEAEPPIIEVKEENSSTYGDGTYGRSRISSQQALSTVSENIPMQRLKLPDARKREMVSSQASLPLFGSPPISSASTSAANSVDLRSRREKFIDQRNRSNEKNSFEHFEETDDLENVVESINSIPEQLRPKISPPRSSPPNLLRELELAINCAFTETIVPRNRTKSVEDYGTRAKMIDEASMPSRPDWKRYGSDSSSTSDTSSDNEGRPNRPTVIRKYTSSDSISLAAPSSLSITPLDRDHHRSVSSLALVEQPEVPPPRRQPKLSQLKRPKPIDAPSYGPSTN